MRSRKNRSLTKCSIAQINEAKICLKNGKTIFILYSFRINDTKFSQRVLLNRKKVKNYDVIVIGVGSMGSSACYWLAKRGYKVLGLEQFEIPHVLGSHGGQSRIIRKAYFE